jgi:hypothetical protein
MKPALIPPVLGAVLLAMLAAAGWFHTDIAPDTASYLAAAGAADPLGASRLPLYGWAAGWMLAHAAPLLAWAQAAIFLVGAALLVAALQRVGLSRAAAAALGVALATSTMLLLWARDAVPEVAGHGFLFIGLAAASLAADGVLLWVLPASIAVTLAWALRPSLLAFTVLAAALPLLLPRRAATRRGARALLLLAVLLAPALGLSAVRAAREGSAMIVSFGGFQMSGMAALMLTPEITARLPADLRPTADAIIAARTALEQAGTAIAIPANSTGEHSFASAALLYFDVLARTHDAVLYGAVLKLRGAEESWPRFDARMEHFALAVLRAAPADYAAWVLGALSRAVGHALVLNPALLLASLLLAGIATWRAMAGGPPAPPPAPDGARDWAILLPVIGLYTLGTLAPVVLVTFPAGRYIDSADLMLAAVPILGVMRLWRR